MGWTVSEAHSASLGHYGATNMHAFLCRVCGVLCVCVRVAVVVCCVIVLRDCAAFTCVRTYVCVCMYVCVCVSAYSLSLSLSLALSRAVFSLHLRVSVSVRPSVTVCVSVLLLLLLLFLKKNNVWGVVYSFWFWRRGV